MTTSTSTAPVERARPRLTDLQASFVRTLTPVLTGGAIAQATGVKPLVGSGIIGGYYALGRLGESWLSRKFGWLLGYARGPAYTPAATAAPPAAAPPDTAIRLDPAAGRVTVTITVESASPTVDLVTPARVPAAR